MVCFFLGWIALSNLPSITHCEELKLTQESSLEGEWLSKKQALDAIGAEELKMRVQAGTIRTRRNKEDSRFWEFRLQTEKDSFRTTKEVSTKVKSELGAQKEDVLQFDAMQREALTAEGFDLEAPSSSSKGVNDDLARFLGISTSKDEKNKTPKENKWELESKVRSQSTKATMEKQLMKFKSEMAKEENLLETTLVDAKSVFLGAEEQDDPHQGCEAGAGQALYPEDCSVSHAVQEVPESGGCEGSFGFCLPDLD